MVRLDVGGTIPMGTIMVLRLGNYVVRGEISFERRNAVFGWLEIRGWTEPLHLELAGNPDPDLIGKLVRFSAPERVYGGMEPKNGAELPLENQQFGAVGRMTANDPVRVFEGSIEQFHRRSKLGEPPPMEWKRCLYLSWSGNNGPVTLELADPELWFVEEVKGKERLVAPPPFIPPPEDPNETEPPAEEVPDNVIEFPGPDADALMLVDEDEDGPEDPFGLFNPELGRYLEKEYGEDLDADESELPPRDRLVEEMDLMDRLIEGEAPGEPLGEFLGETPDWRELDEGEAETALMVALGRLALFRMSYEICEHCSMREAYRILTEELAREVEVHLEMQGTEWVQHIGTEDHCPRCQEELGED